MPTIYNKVTVDGVTYIDLSQDTVTEASHIMEGYIGHLADGTQVTGTGKGGSDPTSIQVYIEQDEDGYLMLTDTALIPTAVGVSF